MNTSPKTELAGGLYLSFSVLSKTEKKGLDVKPKNAEGQVIPGPTTPMTLVQTNALAGSQFVIIQEFVKGSKDANSKHSFNPGENHILPAQSAFLKNNVLYVTLV